MEVQISFKKSPGITKPPQAHVERVIQKQKEESPSLNFSVKGKIPEVKIKKCRYFQGF